MPKAQPKKPTATRKVQSVAMPDNWKHDFQAATFRTSFILALSQPMIEFISAVADGCQWDRRAFAVLHRPDNWIATESSLTNRGLIRRKSREQIDREKEMPGYVMSEVSYCELTPAGVALVELLKVTGVFVVCDAALNKQARS